ncbi:MAG: LamG domain-containing protein [Verrucomicrobia bacterium]|nr:LamG domain-containing protein [Verrucomicrobiota bacterium]
MPASTPLGLGGARHSNAPRLRAFLAACLLGLTFGSASMAADASNRALRLNGTSACLQVPDAPPLHAIASAITLELWCQADSFSPTNRSVHSLIRKNTAAGRENFFLRLRIVDGGPVVEFSAGPTVGIVSVPVALTTGQWYHLAGSYDGRSATVFVNGVALHQEDLSGSLTIDSSALEIGRGDPEYSGGEYFRGLVDDLPIHEALARAWRHSVGSSAAGSQLKSSFPPGSKRPNPHPKRVARGPAGDLAPERLPGSVME